MKNSVKFLATGFMAATLFASCAKMDTVGVLNTGGYTDTSGGPLKSAATFPVGIAIENNLYMNNAAYKAAVIKEASSVTFGNEMKHSSIVQNDGSFNFATADGLYNASSTAGLAVFGHTLGWHSQQNTTYLKNYSGLVIPAATELYTNNKDFENGLSGWSTFNTNGATISANTVAANAHGGNGSMKVDNPTAQTGNQWKVQVSSSAFAVSPGKQYTITYWVKAASAGGSIRLSSGPTAAQYQGDQTIGTTWQQVSWNITNSSSLSSMTFLFDMGQVANTYYIDDVSVKEVIAVPSGAQVSAKLDTALNKWITAIVGRYAGKVKAWDVINELFADDGNIRNNSNTNITPSDVLVWSNYLGRDYPYKAFTYAKAADPAALLFINDYNLETSNAKLDSLIAMVAELKGRGAKVDGIGTQMHISWNTSYAGIDNMMKKLGTTGLLIRISELDVRINPLSKPGFVLTPLEANYQADMYRYVVQSYLKYIPKAQQHGITIWGLSDNTSWLYNNGQDFPLLFNADFSRKQAYSAFLKALGNK